MATHADMSALLERVMETPHVIVKVFDYWNDSGATEAPDGHDELFAMFLDAFESAFNVDN